MIEESLPLPYYKKGSRSWMTLNIYRNLNPYLLNSFKREYGKKIEKIFSKYDKAQSSITINIDMKFRGKRRRDLDNHASIVLKAIQDALVNIGFIIDDDMRYIKRVVLTGEIDCEKDEIIIRIV